MTDREALVWSILENPADDTPRLVFADYLDDYPINSADRARAEYIRLSIEDNNDADGYSAKMEARRSRMLEILALDFRTVAVGIPFGPTKEVTEVLYNHVISKNVMAVLDRGFVAYIRSIKELLFVEQAGKICANHPIRLVELYDVYPDYSVDDIRTNGNWEASYRLHFTEHSAYGRARDWTAPGSVCMELSAFVPENVGRISRPRHGYTTITIGTRDEGRAILSEMCVMYGRAQAMKLKNREPV